MSCNKLYYFVHVTSAGHPIPGTMFAKSNAANNPCGTGIVALTGLPMTAPPGYSQCIGPVHHRRYWYQVDETGAILPNSMIMVQGIPTQTGTGACHYVEYKIFKKVS